MARRPNTNHILVAGLGNELLRDDGVGIHAVRLFLQTQSRLGANMIVAEIGTAVLDALHLIEWADYVLAIDAMQAGGPPGSVYAAPAADIEPGNKRQGGLHELNLLAALRLMPAGPQPQITILGVEPEVIAFGLDLSPRVEAALPRVVDEARNLITKWSGADNLTPAE